MTTRVAPRADSPWLAGLAAIAAYAGTGIGTVNAALQTQELKGHQRKPGGKWRTHTSWVDAWLAGEAPPVITGRRTA